MAGPHFRQASGSPGLGASPEDVSRTKSNGGESAHSRRSFSFLRGTRTPSGQSSRVVSGGKMSKKQKQIAQEELDRQQREAATRSPPKLPTPSTLPSINTLGGSPNDPRPDSIAIVSNRTAGFYRNTSQHFYDPNQAFSNPRAVPVPPIPGGSIPTSRNGDFDPYARTESMTHRGRYSYASSAVSMGTATSPRRVRRRKDPTPFK